MEEEKESANVQQDLFFGLYQINVLHVATHFL